MRKNLWVALVISSAIVAACATAQTSRVQTPDDYAQTAGAIAILALEPFALDAESCDPEKTAICVRQAIIRLRPGFHVVMPQEFSQVAYPGLELTEVPRQPEYIALLLDDSVFRTRIAPLRLRYVVVIGGLTTTRKLLGDVLCGAGYGGGGCLGLAASEKETRMAATVFDVERIGRRREIAASRKGHEYFGMFVIVPFYKPAATMPGACRNIASEILQAVDELESSPDDDLGEVRSERKP